MPSARVWKNDQLLFFQDKELILLVAQITVFGQGNKEWQYRQYSCIPKHEKKAGGSKKKGRSFHHSSPAGGGALANTEKQTNKRNNRKKGG